MKSNGTQPVGVLIPSAPAAVSPRQYITNEIEDLLASLPDPERLSASARRGIIARYTAVLEGNFIYWMTAAYFSVGSTEAHTIIEDNLREEVRDNHPGMLRKFAVAARAVPTDLDVLAVQRNLQDVRLFVAGMSGEGILLMMALFEGFIQRFMPYLADLAIRQGSAEQEYTDVHGICDIAHTQELFRAFDAELALAGESATGLQNVEGIKVLRTLIENIIHDDKASGTR
jgi:hypothetical protein